MQRKCFSFSGNTIHRSITDFCENHKGWQIIPQINSMSALLNCVKLKIGNVYTTAFVDSGAAISVGSTTMLKQLPVTSYKYLRLDRFSVTGFTGTPRVVKNKIRLKFYITDKLFYHDFYVFKQNSS